jgi:hypothetical protein
MDAAVRKTLETHLFTSYQQLCNDAKRCAAETATADSEIVKIEDDLARKRVRLSELKAAASTSNNAREGMRLVLFTTFPDFVAPPEPPPLPDPVPQAAAARPIYTATKAHEVMMEVNKIHAQTARPGMTTAEMDAMISDFFAGPRVAEVFKDLFERFSKANKDEPVAPTMSAHYSSTRSSYCKLCIGLLPSGEPYQFISTQCNNHRLCLKCAAYLVSRFGNVCPCKMWFSDCFLNKR